MFGSQSLETAIGLVLMLFIISLAASSIVEIWSQVAKKRADDLERALGNMLAGTSETTAVTVAELSLEQRSTLRLEADECDRELTPQEKDKLSSELKNALNTFKGTSIYRAAQAGARRRKPSYLSAKAFAEGVGEFIDNGDGVLKSLNTLPPGLRARLKALAREPAADAAAQLTAIKSGLETWFDETMARLEGAYKRWAAWLLLLIGLAIAVAANASAFHVADRLWNDATTRTAVANAADSVVADGGVSELASVADATDKLEQLKLPVGWDSAAADQWRSRDWLAMAAMVAGWFTTAVLVTLGAPFWFDLLTRLVSIRNAGKKPAPASDDPGSATFRQAAAGAHSGSAASEGVESTLAAAFGLSVSTS